MDTLYRLVGADGMMIDSFGVSVGIRVSNTGFLEQVKERFPPRWRSIKAQLSDRVYSFVVNKNESGGPRRFLILYANARRLCRTLSLDNLLDAFETDLNIHIGSTAKRWSFVHAGVVGWKGRAIVMPGRSLSGKTSLVKAFIQAGAAYCSDEFAVFDRDGLVHPFARPLHIRQGETRVKAGPEKFGGYCATDPLPLGLLLMTTYNPPDEWRPARATAGQGMLGLLANSLSARTRPERSLSTFGRALRCANIWQGNRGEADELVRKVLANWDLWCN